MAAVASAFSALSGPLGLGLAAVAAMANEAQQAGQIGSDVGTAMGLGAEPGGLGGPGGGVTQTTQTTEAQKSVASPAPQVQRPESGTEAKLAKEQLRKTTAARRGRRSTLLTGGKGLLGRPSVDIKTLLGW